MISTPIPVGALANWCRAMHHGLGAGLSPVKLLRIQGKSGPAPLRELSREVADQLAKGESLEDALEPYSHRLPPLFLALVAAGEKGGRLDDVFAELATYFENSRRTRQEFLRLMMYPALQFAAAVLVIALLLFILGFLPGPDGKPSLDLLGLGLSGSTGALLFLSVAGVGVTLGAIGFRFVTRNVAYRARLEGSGLIVPGWGPALLAFALHRFCVAVRITHEAALSAEDVVRYAFRATSNSAFLSHEAGIAAKVKRGREIAPLLARSGAPFPQDFLASFAIAEETGQISEVLERLAETYREEGERKLKTATQMTGYAIYALVGLMIVIAIFRIASIYIQQLGV